MKIFLYILFAIFCVNTLTSSEYKVKRLYYGEVAELNDTTYSIEKKNYRELGKLEIRTHLRSIVDSVDCLKLTFFTSFSYKVLNDFEIFEFKESSNNIIKLTPYMTCHNCKGYFSIIIPKNKDEIKLVLKHAEFGMSFFIFSVTRD